MKCLCPLEDRECPGNCSSKERAKRRKARAEQLYDRGRGLTMEQIATQLGVSQQTISLDLESLPIVGKLPPRTSKRGRKGEGRPKGTSKRGDAEKFTKARKLVGPRIAADQPIKTAELEKEHGISKDTFERAALAEQARKELLVELEIRSADLSLTNQQKLNVYIRKQNKQFEQQVNEEVRRRIVAADDAMRANNKQLNQELLGLRRIVQQRGIFTETQYKQLLMLCHPDNSASLQVKAELLQIIIKHKAILIRPETVKVMA